MTNFYMRNAFIKFIVLANFLISASLSISTALAENEASTPKNTMVTLKTNKGDIQISLNAEKAPESVKNFLNYANSGHYDGTIFHRVIKGFMIQGGGFEPGMEQKEVNASIINEADNGLNNDKYTVAMARTNEPHSATSQFFINAKDNDFLNHSSPSPSGWGYAVFGEVVEGKDIVDDIEKVQTGQVGPFGDVPLEDVIIESVVLEDSE
jgi:Peptidyl-prolyl cis-trans isomerase (rotamase) - cyclophilin family